MLNPNPYAGTDLWQLILLRAARSAHATFLVWQPYSGVAATSWTYAEIAREAAAVGTGLSRRGVRRGDRVLIHLENSPEFVISWVACAAIGAVAVTTNSRSAPDELAYYADDSEAVGAITQPRFADLVGRSAPGLRWLAVTDHDAGEPAEPRANEERFGALLDDPAALPPAVVDPTAPISVQYTSGTTSRPKGVVWTHANALWAAQVGASHEGLVPEDRHLVYMPLFHTNALSYSLLASLWVGACIVLVPKWSTSRFAEVSRAHGCTWLSLMGLSGRSLARSPVVEGHSYRLFGSGVCDTPLDARYGVKTVGWWGMTETITQGIVGSPYTPNRPWSMGRPAPEYEIAVVRDDESTTVEPEEPGALLIRGTPGVSLFSGYLNQPRATADSFTHDGWFRTGDLVTLHADGHLSFADRAKDMLKVGAENVAASEIERVILESGLVAEAAVVGRPDPKLDEAPVAFVVPRRGGQQIEAEVLAACEAGLADFKVPRAIHVVQELPRSTLSKINKRELRAAATEPSGIPDAERRWLDDASGDPSGEATMADAEA